MQLWFAVLKYYFMMMTLVSALTFPRLTLDNVPFRNQGAEE